MDEDILRLRVGIFVVIAICILGILIFINGEGLTWQYKVGVKARRAPGVKKGTPIRKYGVLIGRVQDVKVVSPPQDDNYDPAAPDDDYVMLTLGIYSEERIFENEIVSIGSESLLGDAGITILPADGDRGSIIDKGRETIWSPGRIEVRQDPFKMISDMQPQITSTIDNVQETLDVMQQAGKSVDDAGVKINELTTTIQNMFQDEGSELTAMLTDFRKTSESARATFDEFERTFNNLNDIIEDPDLKDKFSDTIAKLPIIVEQILATITTTRDTVKSFGSIPDDVHNSFANIDEFTDQLNERTPEMLEQINSSLKNADRLFKEANDFAITLNKLELENGTVGKLLNDPAIHDAILKTVRNVEETSTKLEPLINDLRMFADAIARNPGAIAKGAIRRGGDGNYKGTAGRGGGIFK